MLCWDTRVGSPIPGRRCSDSPCLSADPVQKIFVPQDAKSGLSMGEKREHCSAPMRPLLANSEVGREFGFVFSTAVCDPSLRTNTASRAAATLCPSDYLWHSPGPASQTGAPRLVLASSPSCRVKELVWDIRGIEAGVAVRVGNKDESPAALRERACH